MIQRVVSKYTRYATRSIKNQDRYLLQRKVNSNNKCLDFVLKSNSISFHQSHSKINYAFSTNYNSSTSPLKNQLQKIKQIPYTQQNMKLLPQVLNLAPNKIQLQSQIKNSINEICPNLNDSKKQFVLLQNKYQDLYMYIKKEILIEEADFQLEGDFLQRAHYYFLKEGKKIRPLMIAMLAQNFKSIIKKNCKDKITTNLNKDLDTVFNKIDKQIKKWGALMQIMHIASLAHDDIVDDSPSRRGQQSQHLKYGSKSAVFSGNYIISKASKTVGEFNSPRLYQIYANTMSSLAQGQIKQLLAKGQNKFVSLTKDPTSSSLYINQQTKMQGFRQMIERYMQKTYYKSAALMCGSLLGVPTIFKLNLGQQFQNFIGKQFNQIEYISFRVGQHYGLSLQLIDDILDYVSTAQEMGKEQMSDLVQGNVTAPVYLAYYHKKQILEKNNPDQTQNKQKIVTLQLLNRRKKSKEDALLVKSWVQEGVGIQLTYILGSRHVEEGIKYLKKFGLQEDDLLAWRYLGNKLMTRRK